jgi:hypothetical protein
MRKLASALVLFFAASSCLAGPKPKEKKLLPPSESHGMTINGYGCDKQQVSAIPSSKDTSVWRLIVWAQYGKKHKRYWQQTYGTYKIEAKETVGSNGESAATGAPIGAYDNPSYDFGPMDKACSEWGQQVKSAFRIEPTVELPPD